MASDREFLQRLNLGLTFPLIVLNVWVLLKVFQFFQPLVSILIAASILAFLLNYAVQLVTSRRVPRTIAVLGVFLLALSIVVAIGITLVPIALGQLNELAKRLPSWFDSGTQQLQVLQLWAADKNINVDLSGIAQQLTDKLSGQLQTLTGRILTFAIDTVGSIVNVILTIVLTFYLLLHGDGIWAGIFQWLPPDLGKQMQTSLRQNFQNYYIGQVTLASFNGAVVTSAFIVMNVPFGILFGLGIAIMGLIPFGGALTVTLIGVLLALENFWLGVKVLVTVILIDQATNNFIAPRLLGNLTGLNPVWVLVALFVGLQLGGPLGLIIAVPIASFIKIAFDSLRSPKPEKQSELPPARETVTSA